MGKKKGKKKKRKKKPSKVGRGKDWLDLYSKINRVRISKTGKLRVNMKLGLLGFVQKQVPDQ